MDLVALEEIRRLKARYLRCLDLKLWDEMAETLTVDAHARYGTPSYGKPLTFEGRDAVIEFFRNAVGPGITTVHFAGQPEIDVDGDTATGTWLMRDKVIVPEHRVVIEGAAYYEDTYRRVDGAWLTASTQYDRLYETMMSMDDVPSLKLTANRWSDPRD
ncbi:nuclear transport factor 2 family protein [Amycolatopsis sp. WAC 01375]|uniref:nuclear transport factor 2 family protein n=1 Tax=unclassified Amycolatopsis TaxID=2618356 RepID=UPI000F7AD191|nr:MULTISPECIES: nuclear transport factor 2 family protein [unclassified Amycolatopsis]RSM80208.1 nuclear transport factor 2 family protein [Amycolatopsis sp. WAC 01375]RSN34314.1 nuclear transport factor 2 family protein [Amycolatopsis sp. WAC 01416]